MLLRSCCFVIVGVTQVLALAATRDVRFDVDDFIMRTVVEQNGEVRIVSPHQQTFIDNFCFRMFEEFSGA